MGSIVDSLPEIEHFCFIDKIAHCDNSDISEAV